MPTDHGGGILQNSHVTLVQDYKDLQIGNFNFGKQQVSSPGPLKHPGIQSGYVERSMSGAFAGSLNHSPVSTVHMRQHTLQLDSLNRVTDKTNSEKNLPDSLSKQQRTRGKREHDIINVSNDLSSEAKESMMS